MSDSLLFQALSLSAPARLHKETKLLSDNRQQAFSSQLPTHAWSFFQHLFLRKVIAFCKMCWQNALFHQLKFESVSLQHNICVQGLISIWNKESFCSGEAEVLIGFEIENWKLQFIWSTFLQLDETETFQCFHAFHHTTEVIPRQHTKHQTPSLWHEKSSWICSVWLEILRINKNLLKYSYGV